MDSAGELEVAAAMPSLLAIDSEDDDEEDDEGGDGFGTPTGATAGGSDGRT